MKNFGFVTLNDGSCFKDLQVVVNRENLGDAVYDEVEPIVAAITPVPGGVGPMTRAMLMRNILAAAKQHIYGK